MRLKPSELKQLGPRALAQLHAQGIDPGGDVPDDLPKPKKARKAPARPVVDLTGLSSFDGETLVIVLPIPNRMLHPNARPGHWAVRKRAAKVARGQARITALEALCGRPAPAWAYATEQTTWYARTRAVSDSDGRLSNCKAYYDGVADAGIVGNDAGLIHEPVVMAWDKDKPRVEIRIKEKR